MTSTIDEDAFVYDVDAAQEHIDTAIIDIEDGGEIDEGDLVLLCLASDILGIVSLRGDDPARIDWITRHRAMLDEVVTERGDED